MISGYFMPERMLAPKNRGEVVKMTRQPSKMARSMASMQSFSPVIPS